MQTKIDRFPIHTIEDVLCSDCDNVDQLIKY